MVNMPRFVLVALVLSYYLLVVTYASPLPPRRYGIDFSHYNTSSLLLNIRGGGKKTSSSSYAKLQQGNHKVGRQDGDINTNIEHGIIVQSILIPRQTSFLKPLRFLSMLLLNISFNSCLQTSGKPLEDTVRRILNMPSPDTTDIFASKVTPIHIYVAKKINTSEILPPGHLPSPLSLLGLFLSMILYIGGTVLLPRWSVGVDVLLNYSQIDVQRDEAGSTLQNWFEENEEIDPYFTSASKKYTPSVLVYDKETQKSKICSLMRSPGYNDDESEENNSHLQHPKRYYFELDKTRYYYDPLQPQDVVNGGPTLHKVPLTALLSNTYTNGLQSNAQLTYAYERYGPYSDISIPVPTLRDAFIQRITSPLVSLQLIGRLLSLIEEESLGRAFANLARLGFQHFNDARRGIASAKTLAEEVQELDKTTDDDENESRFWTIRPVKATTEENELEDAEASSEWVQVSPKDLLPGDVFVVAPIANAALHGSHSLSFPVDALVLDGTCVTEEAALTGETVPQPKVSLVLDDAGDSSEQLDMSSKHRSSCVFAGTKLLYSSNWDEGTESSLSERFNLPTLPAETFTNDPALFLALKTGSYSSRGSIIQSLLKSRSNGFSNRSGEVESMKLIGGLAIFAFGACIFLLLEASDDSHRSSVFKQIVQVSCDISEPIQNVYELKLV